MRLPVKAFPKLLLPAVLSACASVVPGYEELPQPAASPEVGEVVLFTGLNWSGESHRATGTDALAQDIRRAGIPAVIHRPGEWARAADLLIDRQPRPAAVAVYGYSAGGPAAARFARRLGRAGIRIETMVLLETWGAVEVACSVQLALQFRLEPGSALSPARPHCTQVRNAMIGADLVPHKDRLGHLSVAVDPVVMRFLKQQLVRDGSVLRRDSRGEPLEALGQDED
jgi:pimeloyl-ACP methyl ester carboxylesterase